jgi:DNA primase
MATTPVEEIKSRLDVVDVIQGYLRLAKAGINYRGLCPFHTEKTPSFFVSPSRQSWRCFGCDSGGDIITFIEKIEGVEFREALRILADRAGVRLPADNPQARSEREALLAILEEAAKFYTQELVSNRGASARDYLTERGLKTETIQAFRLGYAPNDWRMLLEHLTQIGFKPEDIEKSGLAIRKAQSANGKESSDSRFAQSALPYYDRFRHRIMFPLADANARVLGFTGRIMPGSEDEGSGKYVNTPQTPLFDKGKMLYGLHQAKTEIRRRGHAVIVEGQMDCIMSHQAGALQTVAVSGTALTPWHLTFLKRYSENIAFAFDMDAAGENATKRAISLAQENGLNIKIVRLSGGKDAADIVRGNPQDWLTALESGVSLLDFYFETAFHRNDPKAPQGKKQIADELLPIIARIPHAVEQAHWVGVLGERIQTSDQILRMELARFKAPRPPVPNGYVRAGPPVLVRTRKDRLVEELAAYACRFPESEIKLEQILGAGFLEEIRKHLQDEATRMRADAIEGPPQELQEHIEVLARELESVLIHEELALLQGRLKQEESAGSREKFEHIASDIQRATQRLIRR